MIVYKQQVVLMAKRYRSLEVVLRRHSPGRVVRVVEIKDLRAGEIRHRHFLPVEQEALVAP